MRIGTYCKMDDLYKTYRGYIGTKELMKEGFTNRQIAALAAEAYLEKVCHGYYWMLRCGYQKPKDYKCIEVCLSDPKAVISMESACYYQGILEEEPEVLVIATERTDRSVMKLNFPVERHYFSKSNFQFGMKKKRTEFGSYNIYEIERSLCDMVRVGSMQEDDRLVIEIFHRMKAERERYERFQKYAEAFRLKRLM